MERKIRRDFLTFDLNDSPIPIEGFRKGVSFILKSTYYKVVEEPIFDIDAKEITVPVSYEIYDFKN